MNDEKAMGQVIQIDELDRDHLGEMVRGTVEDAECHVGC